MGRSQSYHAFPYHSEGRHQPEYQKRKIQQTICSGSFRKLSGPKKAGTAVVTAKLNGVSRRITITVSKLAAKPTVKNLKTSVVGIKYGPNNMKTYYTLKFTNTSAKTITTAKIRITTGFGIYDQMYWTRNLTLNLKPGKSMTKTYFIQNMVQAPEKVIFPSSA